MQKSYIKYLKRLLSKMYKVEATLKHKRKPFKMRYMIYPLKLNKAENPDG